MHQESSLPSQHTIYLHFKVPGHLLKLEDFIATASSTATVLYTLQVRGRYGIEELEIYLEPPLPGSFLGKLIVVGKYTKKIVIWTAGAAAALGGTAMGVGEFLDTGMGSGALDEASGLSPEQFGREMVRYVMPEKHDEQNYIASAEDEKLSIAAVCNDTTDFLAKENEADFFNFFPTDKYREAYLARNRFYQTCTANHHVEAVGFDATESFPVSREDFPARIINLPLTDEPRTPSKKIVETETVQIHSPDWSRTRKWLGMTNTKEVYFRIDDDNFWLLARTNELPVSFIPIMQVQWVRPLHTGRQSNVVVRVLEFNGKKISEPLDEVAIHALENDEYIEIESAEEPEAGAQMSFFDS